jgi:hypothetical protein
LAQWPYISGRFLAEDGAIGEKRADILLPVSTILAAAVARIVVYHRTQHPCAQIISVIFGVEEVRMPHLIDSF